MPTGNANGNNAKRRKHRRQRKPNNQVNSSNTNSQNRLNSDQFLPLARIVGFGAALSVGIALCLGSYVDIVASDGPANFILPFIIAFVVAGGLGAGWHVVLAMGAQAATTQAKSIVFAIGFGFTVIGVSTSAWFLAGKIGGSPAIQTHQTIYLGKLVQAERLVAANHAVEVDLLQQTKTNVGTLESDAVAEGKFGKFSGKAGYKGLYETLKNAANALLRTFNTLKSVDSKRRRLLGEARQQIENATEAVAERDSEVFKKSASRAASLTAEADRMRLSGLVRGLSIGSASGDAGQAIRSAARGIGDKADEVASRQRPVIIPLYIPMDAKTAVVAYARPLPWLMAILLEALPLMMLLLLITLPPVVGNAKRGQV